MSKTIRTAKPSSWPECGTDGWIAPPSGPTSAPSLAWSGAAAWIASWRASPARPFPPQASASEPQTPETSGRGLDVALLRYDPKSSSWRTSQGSFNLSGEEHHTLSPFLSSLPGWVTWDARALWAQGMSERPTAETDGSAWPTINYGDAEHGGPHSRFGRGNLHLTGMAAQWPTPQVVDLPNKRANIKRWNGLNSLTSMAETLWATPRAHDAKMSPGELNRHDGLNKEAYLFGRQAPRTPMPGPVSSESVPTSPPPLKGS